MKLLTDKLFISILFIKLFGRCLSRQRFVWAKGSQGSVIIARSSPVCGITSLTMEEEELTDTSVMTVTSPAKLVSLSARLTV